MIDPNSPIIDFYPLHFEEDMNEKQQDWEAIVKIPFIDEARLLKALECTNLFLHLFVGAANQDRVFSKRDLVGPR